MSVVQDLSRAEYVRQVLLTSPYFVSAGSIDIAYLGMETERYSIQTEPLQPVVRKYLRKGATKQFGCYLVGRQNVISDAQRMQVERMYDDLSQWIANLQRGDMPPMSRTNQEVQRLEIVGGHYMSHRDMDFEAAVYRLQLVLHYFER